MAGRYKCAIHSAKALGVSAFMLVASGGFTCLILWHFWRTGPTQESLFLAGLFLSMTGFSVYLFIRLLRSFTIWIEFGDRITVRYLRGEAQFDYADITGVRVVEWEPSARRVTSVGFRTGDVVNFDTTIVDEHFLRRAFKEHTAAQAGEIVTSTPRPRLRRRRDWRLVGAVLRTFARCSACGAFAVGVAGFAVYSLAPKHSLAFQAGLQTIAIALGGSVVSMLACLVIWITQSALGRDDSRRIDAAIWLNLIYIAAVLLFGSV